MLDELYSPEIIRETGKETHDRLMAENFWFTVCIFFF